MSARTWPTRAIADYDGVLRLDPSRRRHPQHARRTLAQEGATCRRRWRDFAAAIKLNPDHVAARANHRSLAQELERLGALKAIAGKPSFNCATARRKVEKAICANPELADLDREVQGLVCQGSRGEDDLDAQARKLRREQEEYIARRNAEYGRPGYDLKKRCATACNRSTGSTGIKTAGGSSASAQARRNTPLVFEPWQDRRRTLRIGTRHHPRVLQLF